MNSDKMVVIPYGKYVKLKDVYTNAVGYDENKTVNEKKILINDNSGEDRKKTNILSDEKYNSEINMIENNDMLSDDDILMYMPKTYRDKCKMIIHHMKNNNMYWDSFGRLILNDECIMKSHIVDLIRDVIGNYKRRDFPQMSRDFSKLLIQSHCPKSLLNKRLSNDEDDNIK